MKKQEGLTLTEMLLVLAIAGAIMVLGLRQYQSFRLDEDIAEVKAVVDVIFQALAEYYYAHCSYNAGLAPPAVLTNPDVVTINDLISDGFLSANEIKLNPLVDNTGDPLAYQGYVTQFNQFTSSKTVPMSGGLSDATVGTIQMWRAQVSVLLKHPTKAYVDMLVADCNSARGANGVQPCSASSPGSYAVWERLPSFAVPLSVPDEWLTNPTVQQFKQMYTVYPIMTLLNNPTVEAGQYFLCGS